MEKVWDYTAVNTFLQCKRKYYYRMYKHLDTETKAPALLFGLAIHSALEEYYKSGSMEAGIVVFEKDYQDTQEGELLRTVANGIKLLEGYKKVYSVEPFDVLDQEIGFVVPIIGDITALWGGRLDALVNWNGALYVLEHKTTSRLNGSYFRQFSPNMQPTSYTFGASEYLGRKCQGVIINALEPWKTVMRVSAKTKKLEDHYARDPISRSDREIENFKVEIIATIKDILDRENKVECGEDLRKCFPRTESNCFNFNSPCMYRDLCMYGEDERLMKKYKVNKWEPYAQKEQEKEEVVQNVI